ncbi:MAG: hypothetical protein AAFQ18_03065 [Pseudomonadota bacterium]
MIDAPLRVGNNEAETLILDGYAVESRPGAASGGQVIRTYDVGTASGVFSGPPGTYTLKIGYFAESDGQSSFVVMVNGVDVFAFDADVSDARLGIRAEAAAGQITLASGDVVTVRGSSNVVSEQGVPQDLARLDTLTFSPVDTPSDPPPVGPPADDGCIVGTTGNDRLVGTLGDDCIEGRAGNDTIEAGEGRDTVRSGEGDDTVLGGLGDDTVLGSAGDDTLNGGLGDDLLMGGVGTDDLFGDGGDDVLLAGEGNDAVRGAEGDDTINGHGGDDTLGGGLGNDLVRGGAGDDRLFGGQDDDILLGDSGNDRLDGGLGDDLLIGGDGIDTFVFDAADPGNDVVRDFQAGDVVFLTGFEFTSLEDAASSVSAAGANVIFSAGDVTVVFEGATREDVVGALDLPITQPLFGLDPSAAQPDDGLLL